MVRPEDLASIPVGPDPGRYVESFRTYEQAGFSHIFVHQVGPEQESFLRFWAEQVAPKL